LEIQNMNKVKLQEHIDQWDWHKDILVG